MFVCLRDSCWSIDNTVGDQQQCHGPLLAGCSMARLPRGSCTPGATSYANTVNIKGTVIFRQRYKARQIISIAHNNMVDTNT